MADSTKRTMEQTRAVAKAQVLALLATALTENGAETVEPFTLAIATDVDGQEIWVEIKFTAKQWKATKTSEAYNPFEKAAEFNAEQAIKQKEADEKAKIKAAKIARDDAKRKEKDLVK